MKLPSLVTLVLLCFACLQSADVYATKTTGILGDNSSAFDEYNLVGNSFWYIAGQSNRADVTRMADAWWQVTKTSDYKSGEDDSYSGATTGNDDYQLVWEDDFDGDSLDEAIWEKLGRGGVDYSRYFTSRKELFAVSNSNMILRGVVNDFATEDTAKYLTGGVRTIKGFAPGKIEICAKIGSAKGAWPALWMLPVDNRNNPVNGEADIMEHLNYDSLVQQTTHSYYTNVLGHYGSPQRKGWSAYNANDYNIFSVEFTADSLVYAVNGKHVITYPRLPNQADKLQYPFLNQPYYLIMDMQLGGSWVGPIDPKTLPVEMAIDWVRYYQRPSYRAGVGDYPLNFYKGYTNRTSKWQGNGRMKWLGSVSVAGQSIQIEDDKNDKSPAWPAYYDKTDKVVAVKAGSKVDITLDYKGTWMAGFAFVDYDRNGRFASSVGSDHKPAKGTELVSYSSYAHYNSRGESSDWSHNPNHEMPSFTLPQNLAPGDYRMRIKVDFNSIDPGGCRDSGNDILDNGGAIVDVTLRVTAAETGIRNVNTHNSSDASSLTYNLQGQATQQPCLGVFIRNGRKFIVR